MATFNNVATTSPASGTTVTATLPTFSAGDIVLLYISGKYNASVTRGSDPSGWTFVSARSGGTVTTGNDAGDSFIFLYAKVMVGGESNPVYTHSAGGNSINATAISYTPASGKLWTDRADLTQIPMAFGNDTTTATPITSGAVTFGTQPNAALGDAVVCFAAAPTDAGSAQSSPTVTWAAGISGGTVTGRSYTENIQGADSCALCWEHVGFTGTSTSTVTMSTVATGATNFYGPVLGVWLREQAVTNASAECATGTGTANNVTLPAWVEVSFARLVTPGASAPATNAPAECATGSGAADDSPVALGLSVESAAGTGAADDAGASLGMSAQDVTGTGTAYDTTVTASSNALAECATGTGAADDPTVSTAAATDAPAEAATGTGAAGDAGASLAVNAEAATGTGTAYDTTVSIPAAVDVSFARFTIAAQTLAGVGEGTGTAHDATVSTDSATSASAECATGTGEAPFDSTGNSVSVELTSQSPIDGTGTAYDATVTTGSSTSANAEAATGTGSADDAGVSLGVNAEVATGTGAAHDTTVTTGSDLSVNAECATATGAADDALARLSPNVLVESAAGTGQANDATVTTGADLVVNAGVATGTGAADDTGSSVGAAAGEASALSAPLEPSAALVAAVEAALAQGVAHDPTFSVGTLGDLVQSDAASPGLVQSTATSPGLTQSEATSPTLTEVPV
jgi:hypothetical protein